MTPEGEEFCIHVSVLSLKGEKDSNKNVQSLSAAKLNLEQVKF